MPAERRHSPRVPLECPVTLVRRRGGPVEGRTQDLGPGGARIVVDRPLSIDEELEFDLALGDARAAGRARVLRQHGVRCYALRFEGLDGEAAGLLRDTAA